MSLLVFMTVQQSRAMGKLECFFVGLIPLAIYATGATIGNGQITIHIMALLVASICCWKKKIRL